MATKRENFVTLRNMVADNAEMVTFLDKLIEQIDNRKPSENSKAKRETAERAEKVFAALSEMSEPVTVSELIKMTSVSEVREFSNQRVAALLKHLGNRVTKEVVKGKSYFKVA